MSARPWLRACSAVAASVAASVATSVAAGVVGAVGVLAVLGAGAGCAPGIDANNPVSLSAFDPELLVDTKTFVFSFSTTKTCADLMDLAPDALDEALAAEEAPLQLLAPGVDEHVFGKVTPDVPIAYFVLASAKGDLGQLVQLRDFKGTVFAMGCRDLTVRSGTRQDLPITLFPVGLR